ncbi:MAG: hypothetical protein C4K49_09955 [Candidatus Thorarchaeota archaeon]|nr:MAG: hypothetical protein C4K49_09955 [Candidatus Thorarchaeota archaeon]
MVTGYEVSEDGTLQEVQLTKEGLDSTKVVCVVDDETKSIYLWKGSRADIRRKFVGARVATNLRTEYGFHFKVRPVEEGEEPPTFFSALDGSTAATRVIKPGETAPPQRPAAPAPKPRAAAPEVAPEPPATAPSPRPQAPAPSARAAPPPPVTKPTPASATPPQPRPAGVSAIPSATQESLQDMIKELENEPTPEGYKRELLIVYNELYTVAEHKVVVFGHEKVERRFEKVRDPPEGTFMAEGFIPRVIVKDRKVLGIELLKGTPESLLSPIKTEMKERLTDLISFFKSELEAGAPEESAEPKAEKKRKLVAK